MSHHHRETGEGRAMGKNIRMQIVLATMTALDLLRCDFMKYHRDPPTVLKAVLAHSYCVVEIKCFDGIAKGLVSLIWLYLSLIHI